MKPKYLLGILILFGICYGQWTLPPGKKTEIMKRLGKEYVYQYDKLSGKPKMKGFKGKTVDLVGYVSKIDVKNGKITRFEFYGRQDRYEEEEWKKWIFDGRHVRFIYLRNRVRLKKHLDDLTEDNFRMLKELKKRKEAKK